MNIHFGQVIYAQKTLKNSNHNKIAEQAIVNRLANMTKSASLALSSYPRREIPSHNSNANQPAYISRVITDKHAQGLLRLMGIDVSLKDSKEVNQAKIEAGLAQIYPDASLKGRFLQLSNLVTQYTELIETANQPISRINLKG